MCFQLVKEKKAVRRRQNTERKQGAAKGTAKTHGGEISLQRPARDVLAYSQLRRCFQELLNEQVGAMLIRDTLDSSGVCGCNC